MQAQKPHIINTAIKDRPQAMLLLLGPAHLQSVVVRQMPVLAGVVGVLPDGESREHPDADEGEGSIREALLFRRQSHFR